MKVTNEDRNEVTDCMKDRRIIRKRLQATLAKAREERGGRPLVFVRVDEVFPKSIKDI